VEFIFLLKSSKEQHLFELEIFCNTYKCLYCHFWSIWCILIKYIFTPTFERYCV